MARTSVGVSGKDDRARVKAALAANVVIVALVAVAVVLMVFDIGGGALTSGGVRAFKFYTVDSNVLEGIAALVSAVFCARSLRGGGEPPRWANLLKLSATGAVTLTFLVVIFFLVPTTGFDLASMYSGGNFLMHLVVPALAVATYAILEHPTFRTRRERLWCLVPTAAYEVFYGANALTHVQDGAVPAAYDWYRFLAAGPESAIVVVPLILAIAYLIVVAIDRLAAKAARAR